MFSVIVRVRVVLRKTVVGVNDKTQVFVHLFICLFVCLFVVGYHPTLASSGGSAVCAVDVVGQTTVPPAPTQQEEIRGWLRYILFTSLNTTHGIKAVNLSSCRPLPIHTCHTE